MEEGRHCYALAAECSFSYEIGQERGGERASQQGLMCSNDSPMNGVTSTKTTKLLCNFDSQPIASLRDIVAIHRCNAINTFIVHILDTIISLHHPNSSPRHTSFSHTPTLLLPSFPLHLVHIPTLHSVVLSLPLRYPSNSLMHLQNCVIFSVPNIERLPLIHLWICIPKRKIYQILIGLIQIRRGENQWLVLVLLVLAAG